MSDTIKETTTQQIIDRIINELNICSVPFNQIQSTTPLKHYGMDYIDVMPLLQNLDTIFGLVPGAIADYIDSKQKLSFNENIFPSSFYDMYNNLCVLDLVEIVCKLKGVKISKTKLIELLNQTLLALHKKTQSAPVLSTFVKEK